jgi:hypothetical protein
MPLLAPVTSATVPSSLFAMEPPARSLQIRQSPITRTV